ncbi:hypothetical protein DYU05_07155 [Mucilaginibacter terrenus]|uniref:Uncharacterized protein n=2 Tax=Mucilaginibacter terrenus TaxID=2482727 RepID=A0A3E2NWI6_9SPHI|nr:hypothetical protein DYU05_07155 [Mucilaginibacter terrenus]
MFWHSFGYKPNMKVVHLNAGTPVKTTTNAIVDLFTKQRITLKTIHERLVAAASGTQTSQFTGFIA